MTLHADDSKQGAAFIHRRSKANPQELLIEIIEQWEGDLSDKKAKDKLFEKFRRQLRAKNDAFQHAVDWYFFINMFNHYVNLDRRKTRKPRVMLDANQIREQVRQRVAEVGLMYMMLPSCNKYLKDATFAECSKESGVLAVIAKMGRPEEIVGRKLTEKQLKAVIKNHEHRR